MKLQTLYPFDSTVTDINNIYHTIEDDGHYINSPCIVTYNRIVHTGTTYLFVLMPGTPKMNVIVVKLLDVYFDNGFVHLQLMDIVTGRTYQVKHIVRPDREEDCIWKLFDFAYVIKMITKHMAKEHKKDSLLEFDF
ncbi:MAG TPA: hypothetical protein VIK14_07830 [Ignavibacteria bacterium]